MESNQEQAENIELVFIGLLSTINLNQYMDNNPDEMIVIKAVQGIFGVYKVKK